MVTSSVGSPTSLSSVKASVCAYRVLRLCQSTDISDSFRAEISILSSRLVQSVPNTHVNVTNVFGLTSWMSFRLLLQVDRAVRICSLSDEHALEGEVFEP